MLTARTILWNTVPNITARTEEITMAAGQSRVDEPDGPRSRAQAVKPGHLPVSEFAFDRAGAASPFGDDITFPLATTELTYRHPTSD